MIIKQNLIDFFEKKNFLFFLFILILLSLFFAPLNISANEYAFISRAMNFFNTNENFIGYSNSIRATEIRVPFYFFL